MKKTFFAAIVMALLSLSLASCEKDELPIHTLTAAPEQSDDNGKTGGADNGQETTAEQEDPADTPAEERHDTPEDNAVLAVRGPQGITVTAVILDGTVHSAGITLAAGNTEVFAWHQDTVRGTVTLSVEYEDTDGTPRRFTFLPSDDDWRPTLNANIAAGRTTVFTVDLYTSSVKAE